MKTRLRHALLASGLAAAFVGSLTVTGTVASAGPMAPAAALPPLKIQDAEVIRPLPEPWQAPVRGFRITGTFGAGEGIGAVGLTGNRSVPVAVTPLTPRPSSRDIEWPGEHPTEFFASSAALPRRTTSRGPRMTQIGFSTGTDVREDRRTVPTEDGDHERFSHYVEKDKLTEAMVMGTPVVALCGKVWVPSRAPEKFPVCPECQEIWESLKPGGSGDGEE